MTGDIVRLMRFAQSSYNRALALEHLETLRRLHVAAEGRGPVNENPDGCYYCGSAQHHSSDCNDSQHDIEGAQL